MKKMLFLLLFFFATNFAYAGRPSFCDNRLLDNPLIAGGVALVGARVLGLSPGTSSRIGIGAGIVDYGVCGWGNDNANDQRQYQAPSQQQYVEPPARDIRQIISDDEIRMYQQRAAIARFNPKECKGEPEATRELCKSGALKRAATKSRITGEFPIANRCQSIAIDASAAAGESCADVYGQAAVIAGGKIGGDNVREVFDTSVTGGVKTPTKCEALRENLGDKAVEDCTAAWANFIPSYAEQVGTKVGKKQFKLQK